MLIMLVLAMDLLKIVPQANVRVGLKLPDFEKNLNVIIGVYESFTGDRDEALKRLLQDVAMGPRLVDQILNRKESK